MGAKQGTEVREREPAEKGIEIRHCHGLAEFQACLELERRVWGAADVDLVPTYVFVVMAEIGGQVLGAFDPQADGRMIGFTLAFPGFREGRTFLHSHMTAVIPEYQNRGVGRQLKLFQREDALERGIELVEWTFDPMELRNAYFNIERLGATMRRYLPNLYGITTSPLHGSLPTDRLVAEWWLKSERVTRLLREGKRPRTAAETGAEAARIVVPRDFGELRARDRNRAAAVQARVREEFQHWFGRGYEVTGLEVDEQNGTYVLVPYANSKGDFA